MKRCPYCAEQVQDEAIKCRFCGEMLTHGSGETGKKEVRLEERWLKFIRDYEASNQAMKFKMLCSLNAADRQFVEKELRKRGITVVVGSGATAATQPNQNFVGIGCLAIVLLGGYYLFFSGGSEQPRRSSGEVPRSSESTFIPTTGQTVKLAYPDSGVDSFLAVDDDSWNGMSEALAAKDNYGLIQLILAGKVHRVKSGTKALILDTGFTSIKVRLLDGESAGVSGWIVRAFSGRPAP